MKYFQCIVFLMCSLSVFSQYEYEYLGIISLGEDAIISYKISFDEKNGIIEGKSLTDLGGPHETLSYLSGYFDDKANTLEFYESGIVYTKSTITQNDFCFVHFSGSMKNLNERQNVEGNFKGLYSDGKECISGEIKLSNFLSRAD